MIDAGAQLARTRSDAGETGVSPVSQAEAPRACPGTTKLGERCRVPPHLLGEDGYCNRHAPDRAIDPAELGRRGGLASGEVRREQSKSIRDRLREKVEEQFELVWSAFEAGLLSDDERARVIAAVQVLDQAYGKTPQAIIGDPDQPVTFVLDSVLERARRELESRELES